MSTFFGHIVLNVRYCSGWIVHWILNILNTRHIHSITCAHILHILCCFRFYYYFFIIFYFIRVFNVGVRISLWIVSDALKNFKCEQLLLSWTELNWVCVKREKDRERKRIVSVSLSNEMNWNESGIKYIEARSSRGDKMCKKWFLKMNAYTRIPCQSIKFTSWRYVWLVVELPELSMARILCFFSSVSLFSSFPFLFL